MKEVDPRNNTVRIEDVRVVRHSDTLSKPSVDLSRKVTPPTNQGRCGSCWAISTTQCLRDRINAKRRRSGLQDIPELSFQFIIDCSKHCVTFRGRKGCSLRCNGGFLATSYEFLKDVGVPREKFHPNRHSNQSGLDHIDNVDGRKVRACPRHVDEGEVLYKCKDYYNVHIYEHTFGITNARTIPHPMSKEELNKNAINIANEIAKNGPVAVCFNLYSDFKEFWNHPNSANIIYRLGWNLPRSIRDKIDPVGSVNWTQRFPHHGIYFKTGHSISIVGYGSQEVPGEGMVDYWICRNSWGRPHNTYNRGFFKIWRGINASAIEADVGAPEVSTDLAKSFPLMPSSSTNEKDTSQHLMSSTSTITFSQTETDRHLGIFILFLVFIILVCLSIRK